MSKISLWAQFRYSFDNIMAKGTPALIGLLTILSALVIFFFAAIAFLVGAFPDAESQYGFFDLAWMSLMRTLDSGTMGGDTGNFGLVMLGVTLGGIFIISTLIGILSTGLEAKMDELRKGRSLVVESGHTVILGWNDQVFTVISELVEANLSNSRSCIVIMGPKDKTEMEDEIRDKLGKTGRTRIVCRNGDPIDVTDLSIVNPNSAKSIIILSSDSDNADAEVIKTLLAITNHPDRKKAPFHIIAEIRDPQNVEVAKIVGRDEVEIILVGDLVSRIIAQTCRQPGLSVVYTELLDFGGSEMYFREEPALVGKTYAEALFAYPQSTVFGIFRKGAAQINPPMETKLESGDLLVLIAEDDSSIKLGTGSLPPVKKDLLSAKPLGASKPEKTLILGWNWRAPIIVRELDGYVPAGSEVLIVADVEDGESLLKNQLGASLKNLSVRYQASASHDRKILDALEPTRWDHIILLCYSDHFDSEKADSLTLITLLHLRDISEKADHPLTIVSEMLNIKNKELAEVAKVNDFIVSDKLISLLIAQVSETKQLNQVFADVFDPDGSEIYLKPADGYVQLAQEVNFYTVLESARLKGETAIGYKIAALADDAQRSYGVTVNPDKNAPLSFQAGDKIIVASES